MDGGFLVQLEFVRHPTSRFTAHLDIYVPVNQIVNLGDFYLIDRSASPSDVQHPVIPPPPFEGAVRGVGGSLPASPVFSDLWLSGLFPVTTPGIKNSPDDSVQLKVAIPPREKSTCTDGLHDISALDGPTLMPLDFTEDVVACLDSAGSICVSKGVLSHRVALDVGLMTYRFRCQINSFVHILLYSL